jgi:hypothetical protein
MHAAGDGHMSAEKGCFYMLLSGHRVINE